MRTRRARRTGGGQILESPQTIRDAARLVGFLLLDEEGRIRVDYQFVER